jgi:hypothetical protein
MHDEKRVTGGEQFSNAVIRALAEPGGLTVRNMRAPGFRALDELINTDGFRALAPLPERSQIVLDNAVVEVGLERLTFAADIMAAGLTYNLSDPLSLTQLAWNKSNKVGAAQRTMSPSARGENKLPAVLEDRLPIYLTTDNFSLDIRTLKMSQRVGMPLDTALIKACTRSVNEAIEDAAINGATTIDGQDLQVAGYSAPGLVNAPNAATQALTAAAWDATPVGATIYTETQAMLTKLRANKKYGPYRMYVNTEVGANLDADYVTAAPQNTIKERLLKIEGLQAIRTADMMPAAKVVVVQMTSDVIDMVVGQKPTVIPYTSLDSFTFHNLVMAIMIPRVRSDYDGASGVCVGTIA